MCNDCSDEAKLSSTRNHFKPWRRKELLHPKFIKAEVGSVGLTRNIIADTCRVKVSKALPGS